MKTWTVVLEFENVPDEIDKNDLENRIMVSFSIAPVMPDQTVTAYEIVQAPYGPQHKDGVWLAEKR